MEFILLLIPSVQLGGILSNLVDLVKIERGKMLNFSHLSCDDWVGLLFGMQQNW